MTIAVPYSWLKQVSPDVLRKEKVPPFGYPPPFPWEQLAELFGPSLQEQKVTFTPREWRKLTNDALLLGFGSFPQIFTIDLSPFSGNAWVVVSETELDRFISLLLTKKEDLGHLLDPQYRKGFCEFMALEFFNVFRKLDYAKGLTPHLLADAPLESDSLYAQDVDLTLGESSAFSIRILFSEELRHAWKEKFAERTVLGQISIPLAEKLSLILHLEAGNTTLTHSEWQQLQPGDFLLLDQCSIDPTKAKGRVMLTLDRRPLYRARLKDGQLKILEFPLYHEVESAMATHDSDKDFDDSFEDHDHYENSEASFDSTIEDEERSSAEAENAEDEKTGEIDADSTHTDHEALAEESPAPFIEDEKVNVGNLPLTVVVEVGRLQMSVRKLLELQPGDTLDLDSDPDSSVDLVVNGTIVGKGELLKVSEALGVRILDKV